MGDRTRLPAGVYLDLTPRPVMQYSAVWSRDGVPVDEKVLNAWCRKGWVPGAYKHPSGAWWVRPLELLEFDPSVLGSAEDEEQEGSGEHGRDSRPMVRKMANPGRGRIRR